MEYKEIKCFDCDGTGNMEGANPICNKAHSICCGGCASNYTCTTCHGKGDLYAEDENIVDYMLMLDAYEKMSSGYKKTLIDFNKMIKSVSENGLLEMELLLDHTHKIQLGLIKDQLKRIEKHTEILQNEIRKEYE